jgi:glutamate racemase
MQKKSSILNHESSIRKQSFRVGVFDSGLGGLTVVQSLLKELKNAEIFYLADTLHAPYGTKTKAQILQFSLDIAEYFLKHHDIDALIVACNTATSAAIEALREKYPALIIIGAEPGIKPAIEMSVSGKIGVLATPATLEGEKYQQLANRLSNQKSVTLFEQECPGLVEQIEQGETHTVKTMEMLEGWLSPMRKEGVDTIVLGCTHYPLVADAIREVMHNTALCLVETSGAISRRVIELGEKCGHENRGKVPSLALYTTGEINALFVQTILEKETYAVELIAL